MNAGRVLRRTGLFLAVVWAAATLNFFLPRLARGRDPVRENLGQLVATGGLRQEGIEEMVKAPRDGEEAQSQAEEVDEIEPHQVVGDYIRYAEANGLRPRTVFLRSAMRNAILPQFTSLALSLGYVVSGSVLVRKRSSIPRDTRTQGNLSGPSPCPTRRGAGRTRPPRHVPSRDRDCRPVKAACTHLSVTG